MKKYFDEFPTKFWVIFGLTMLGFAFVVLMHLGYFEVGQMGIRYTP